MLRAPPESIFEFLDVHENITMHMERRSWATLGATMTTTLDHLRGQAVGSVIKIEGSVAGIPLSAGERVVTHDPPFRKRWETVGVPRLIVIGCYSMGFEIEPTGEDCRVTVFIDFELPRTLSGALLGRACGPVYAKWCVGRTIDTATTAFAGNRQVALQPRKTSP